MQDGNAGQRPISTFRIKTFSAKPPRRALDLKVDMLPQRLATSFDKQKAGRNRRFRFLSEAPWLQVTPGERAATTQQEGSNRTHKLSRDKYLGKFRRWQHCSNLPFNMRLVPDIFQKFY